MAGVRVNFDTLFEALDGTYGVFRVTPPVPHGSHKIGETHHEVVPIYEAEDKTHGIAHISPLPRYINPEMNMTPTPGMKNRFYESITLPEPKASLPKKLFDREIGGRPDRKPLPANREDRRLMERRADEAEIRRMEELSRFRQSRTFDSIARFAIMERMLSDLNIKGINPR